jgi:uncharacterized membrane protein YvlD (DUF360 family)
MNIIDIGLIGSYILIVLCALAAIIIPLIQSFSDPKSLIKSGLATVVMVVVFFICYALADGNAEGTDETTSKYVGAGILTTYVFFFVAIGGIVYSEISKMLK